MTPADVIRMAKEAGLPIGVWGDETEHFARLVTTAAASEERERICLAIKEEDDYCITEGDYMLDSDDCISVAKGKWIRPEFSPNARNQQTGAAS